MSFEHLLAPGRIGSLELRNRLLMTPMGEELANLDGTISDAQIAYLEARAKGGLGAVTLGSVSVAFPGGASNKRQTGISDDHFIPGLKRAATRMHQHGSAMVLQLTHAGKNGLQDLMAGRPMWVPSEPGATTVDPLYSMVTEAEAAMMSEPYTAPTSQPHYRVLDHDGIAELIDQFASATVRAREAGIDAIELHAGHGYLLDAFLSPSVNTREDEYGGTLENRARLLLETLREIRKRVGADYPVWIRLNSEEVGLDGETFDETKRLAPMAIEAGADAIHLSRYHDPGIATGPTDSYIPHTPELLVDNARTIRSVIDAPVITVGRISPERADALIAEGAFDFLAMGRQILAEPELARNLREGRPEQNRPCVYHYRCIGQIFVRSGTRCVANAFLGREHELGEDRRLAVTAGGRRVVVIGGGPAGLEAARVAAIRGHRVTLHEASGELGGRFRHAAATSTENAELLAWLVARVEEAGVDIRLHSAIDEPGQLADADAVLVATGGAWRGLGEAIDADPRVRGVDQLDGWLSGADNADAEHIVVVGGDIPGLALAQHALNRGANVTLIERSAVFGTALGLPGRWRMVADLRAAGVELVGEQVITALDNNGVVTDSGSTHRADLVIVAEQVTPASSLATALADLGVPVTVIGDAAAAELLEGAMRTAVEAIVGLG